MVVYWEYAFAENFLIDGLLLYLALKCARAKVSPLMLALASAVGAAEAIVFPLLELPAWAAYLVKFAGGTIVALLSVRKGKFKTYLVTTLAFFFFTFALGGLLTAVYSFFGVETEGGNAFIVERAPVALVLAAAGIFVVVGVQLIRLFYRYRKIKRNLFSCVLRSGEREVNWKGYVDSGNLLSFRGEPVSVISPAAAFALFGRNFREAGRITVNTVNGGRDSPVLLCEEMTIKTERGEARRQNVLFAIGDVRSKEYQIILHTALTEGTDENSWSIEKNARKGAGKRERHQLPVRERGVAAAPFGRGRGGDAAKARGGRGRRGGKGEAHRT